MATIKHANCSEEGAELQCGSTKTRLWKRKQVDLFCCRPTQYATYNSSLWTNSSRNNLWPVKCSSRRLGASCLNIDSLSSFVFCLQEVQYSQKNLHLMYVVGSKSFRPDQVLKVTEIKQICYFST